MKKQYFFKILLIILLIASVAMECSSQQQTTTGSTSTESTKTKDIYISIGGGSLGGVWYSIAGGAAELIQKNIPGSIATAQATGAAVENLRLLGSGEIQIGISDTITDYSAWKGQDPFDKPIQNFSRLGPGIQPIFQMVVSDKDINSWEDLNGKRIAVGAAGSSTLTASRQVFPILGLNKYKSEVIGYRPGAMALRDGKVDAVWQLGAIPFPTITELATTKGIHLLPITKEFSDKISIAYPYYAVITIPAGTYPGQDKDIPSLSFQSSFYVDNSMADDLVYKITKAFYSKEGLTYFSTVTKSMAYIDRDFLLKWATQKSIVPIHPGAQKFYDELAGE